MDWEFDSAYVLYGLGVILGIVSLVYFGSELILGLSPTTKSNLLFILFALFLATALSVSNRTVTTISYLLAAASYVVLLAYIFNKFDFETETTFLILAVSSALFIGLGYLIRERGLDLELGKIKQFTVAAIVLALVFIAVDVNGPGVTYTIETVEEVNLSQRTDVTVGELEARNGFWLSREMDVPRYQACIYDEEGEKEETHVELEGERYDLLEGGERRQLQMKIYAYGLRRPAEKNQEPKYSGMFAVEQAASCPANAVSKVVVTQKEGLRPY